MLGLLPPELLIGSDCLVRQHQPPPLAAAYHRRYRITEDTAAHHRVIQFSRARGIVPGDFERTFNQRGQRFDYLSCLARLMRVGLMPLFQVWL